MLTARNFGDVSCVKVWPRDQSEQVTHVIPMCHSVTMWQYFVRHWCVTTWPHKYSLNCTSSWICERYALERIRCREQKWATRPGVKMISFWPKHKQMDKANLFLFMRDHIAFIYFVYCIPRPRDPSNPIRVATSFNFAYVIFKLDGYRP